MTILVTGATGAVGRHIVAELVTRGAPVRALTRTPATADLPDAVEVVAGDLGDPGSLTDDGFAGVERVFVFPAQQGVDTLVSRALQAGAGRFVVLSSLAAAAEHPRDVGSASNFHHAAVEEAVTSRTDDVTILRPGTFANNLLSWAYPIRSGFPIRAPYLASAQAPIHEADVADAAVAALLDSGSLRGTIHPLTGPEALTRAEQVATIGAAIGRDIPLVEITPEEFRAETAAFIPDAIVTMLLDYWRDTVDEPDVPRPVTPLTGARGRSLATWAADHRGDFVGS